MKSLKNDLELITKAVARAETAADVIAGTGSNNIEAVKEQLEKYFLEAVISPGMFAANWRNLQEVQTLLDEIDKKLLKVYDTYYAERLEALKTESELNSAKLQSAALDDQISAYESQIKLLKQQLSWAENQAGQELAFIQEQAKAQINQIQTAENERVARNQSRLRVLHEEQSNISKRMDHAAQAYAQELESIRAK